ncbi:7429_t:CDS:10 [Diversispora eburnea]|uniref:7429_t:CDS:1 n=1 Tax=Diversispora eburnea TaxID=1213867 RepID=A0A9N9A9Z9_9GLOM|nr:7429_t:CDS:10 [Diversispora eburnea]
MAPEYVLDESLEFANDMFALGSLIYTIHSHGKPPMENRNSIHNYRKNVENLSKIKYDHLPYHLHEVMFNLLTRYPSQRMTASEFQTSKYFDNVLVSTVKFFESFPEKSKDDKANFMKGLIRILPQFPERVLMRKKLPNSDFCVKVLDPLKPIFSITEPMQNMISCLDKIELFQQKTSSTIFKEDVMPLIYNALEAKTLAIQEKVLKVMPAIIESLDLLTIKSSLFPRIQFTITEKLIPLLKGIKTKEPNVMITALAVYDEMGKNVEKDVIATEVLPQLWKMSVKDESKDVINDPFEIPSDSNDFSSTFINSLGKSNIVSHHNSSSSNRSFSGSHITIQPDFFDSTSISPPLTPHQQRNSLIQSFSSGVPSLSSQTITNTIPMGNLNNLYTSSLSSTSTTTSFTNPQNSLNLNLGNILKPNASSSDDNNNKSTSHKKQADLTMFDPFS